MSLTRKMLVGSSKAAWSAFLRLSRSVPPSPAERTARWMIGSGSFSSPHACSCSSSAWMGPPVRSVARNRSTGPNAAGGNAAPGEGAAWGAATGCGLAAGDGIVVEVDGLGGDGACCGGDTAKARGESPRRLATVSMPSPVTVKCRDCSGASSHAFRFGDRKSPAGKIVSMIAACSLRGSSIRLLSRRLSDSHSMLSFTVPART